MKLFAILLLAAAVVAEELYTTENDDIDVDAIVNSDKILKSFYGCFMDTNPCNDVQASIKKYLPEAIQQSCAKCTAGQKNIMKRFFEALKQKFPQDYNDFQKKFDPESKYFAHLETAISA